MALPKDGTNDKSERLVTIGSCKECGGWLRMYANDLCDPKMIAEYEEFFTERNLEKKVVPASKVAKYTEKFCRCGK